MKFSEPDTPDGTVKVKITYTQHVYENEDAEDADEEMTSFPKKLYKKLNPGDKSWFI